MHRGIQELLAWCDGKSEKYGAKLAPPASATDFAYLEGLIASPLPADLRAVLTRYNGGALPTGQLLAAGTGNRVPTIERAMQALAQQHGASLEAELLLPFFKSTEGSLLAFDRSAGPVADTWPVVDLDEETGVQRLVHRTLDGWCRVAVQTWSSEDFAKDFTLERYLTQGARHVAAEPDVSVAHATVAHALRRAGRPEQALSSYLQAARCVPAEPFCDWQALQLAALSGDTASAWEAAQRVSARAPSVRWRVRETTPVQVADVLGRIAGRIEPRDPVLRLFDQLAEQVENDEDRAHVTAIRRAVFNDEPPPPPAVHRTAVPPQTDHAAWWQALRQAYADGQVPITDLLLDPAYDPLRAEHDFAELLRIPREF